VNFQPRQKIYLGIATGILLVHLLVAASAKSSFALTMFGDAVPCALLLLAILAMRANFRNSAGVLSVFWKVFAGGLGLMLLSQLFWFYYDWRRLTSTPSPVVGDALFLLAHVFFLSALALRPHSSSAGLDLRIRSLDFALLSLWWLCLYGYFALPWQYVIRDFGHYNPAYYWLALLQHLVLVTALTVLAIRKSAAWRKFYLLMAMAFVLIAGGNLLLNMAIDSGSYYAGSFYDTSFFSAIYMFTLVACCGASLDPHEDSAPNRELVQSVWTARIAMLVILSLPLIALLGLQQRAMPPGVSVFRLHLVFGSMFVLGALVYWKLSMLARELVRLVRLTHASIENLKAVQRQVTHSEKLEALGGLAAGAAHEISNPLTAILGYSELLADIPGLSPDDRAQAGGIREQVRRAQAAVASLRNRLQSNPLSATQRVDKKPIS
jgi:hypothetical protein